MIGAIRKDYLKFCRYYKGEKNNPYENEDKAMFWEYEKVWIDEMSKPEESDLLVGNTSEYINAGLLSWNETDGTPYLLKALLFNRYRQWLGGYGLDNDIENFKKWYQTKYKGQD